MTEFTHSPELTSLPIPQSVDFDAVKVASWLAARGMVMIDREELAALRRNGASGPPPIPAEVYRRISRY